MGEGQGWGPGGRAVERRRGNPLQHAVDVPENLFVREAEHFEADARELLGAAVIVFGIDGVPRSIDLDDQLRTDAQEVDRIDQKGYLPSPFEAREPPASKRLPELVLGGGRMPAKVPSETALLGRQERSLTLPSPSRERVLRVFSRRRKRPADSPPPSWRATLKPPSPPRRRSPAPSSCRPPGAVHARAGAHARARAARSSARGRGSRSLAPRRGARSRRRSRHCLPSRGGAARRAPPSRRGPPGWPRSGSSRPRPDRRAACSPRRAPPRSPAGS